MELHVRFRENGLAKDILSVCGPDGRMNLFSVGSNALRILVQSHVRRIAPAHHRWARLTGGRPTGHLTKGARAVTSHASASYGSVSVPIPGIERAFQDLTIEPHDADMLTIPHRASGGVSYGRRAREVQSLGWRLFRGRGSEKARHLLFGRRGKETRILYTLKERVVVPMDRSLLPSDRDVQEAVDTAMMKEIWRVARKVCRMSI